MVDYLYCPRCGKQFCGETSFCRTCGLSLDGVSEIVHGESETAPEMVSRPNFKLIRVGIGLFIFGLVIGLLNGALKDFELFPQAYGRFVFLAIIALGMLMLGAGFLFPTKQYKKRKPISRKPTPDTGPPKEQLNAATLRDIVFPIDTRELDPIAVGSVTEGTTRSLKNKN
jgi:hypothetical protein